MKPLLTSRTVIVAVVLAISAVGCGSAHAQQAQSGADTLPTVLATVGNETITLADVRARIGDEFDKLDARIEQKYGDRIAIIYRQFPLSRIHPRALKAAQASLCAYAQDKFWEMHDLMYQEYAKLSVSNLKEKARRLGLDAAAFDACLDSGKHAEQVQRDHKEGTLAGVNSTPTIFLNGEVLEESSITYELMSAAIDRELARRT